MDSGKQRIYTYLSSETKERALKKAKEMSISMSSLLAISLNEYLKQESVVDMAEIFKKMQNKLR